MTNEEIIMKNRVFLMENGVIKGTGEKFTFTDENGTREIDIPEEIHTFDAWKKLGYVVKKGEHSVARFPIWQLVSKKKDKGDKEEDKDEKSPTKGYYHSKVAFFFTKEQVEPIKE